MYSAPTEPRDNDSEFYSLLEDFLQRDITISARSIVRSHSKLKAASSITRHKARLQTLNDFKAKQEELRRWRGKIDNLSKLNVSEKLSKKDQTIKDLEQQVHFLTESHLRILRIIGEVGGFSKWVNLFDPYESIMDEIAKLGAIPEEFPSLLAHPTTARKLRNPRRPTR